MAPATTNFVGKCGLGLPDNLARRERGAGHGQRTTARSARLAGDALAFLADKVGLSHLTSGQDGGS